MGEKIRVLVVDDQNIARSFFEMHVKTSVKYELVASKPSAEAAAAYCDSSPVDLVLMDILMKNGMDGLSAAEQIKRRHPSIRIIVTTSTAEASWVRKAKEIGIESFWYKEYSEEPLLEVMDRTMAGENVYPEEAPKLKLGLALRDEFTERELSVLREITSGATNDEIADRLKISLNTVKWHVQHLLDKTGYETRTALAVNARRSGIVVSDNERRHGKREDGEG